MGETDLTSPVGPALLLSDLRAVALKHGVALEINYVLAESAFRPAGSVWRPTAFDTREATELDMIPVHL